MREVMAVTGTRADFGLMEGVLHQIESAPDFNLRLFATGIHLMPEFGSTINIVRDSFPNVKIIDEVFTDDTRFSMGLFTAQAAEKFTKSFSQSNPNVVLLLGDRPEQAALVLAAYYTPNTTIVHLHGGELSGNIDNKLRGMIATLADWHLPPTEQAKTRLINLGIREDKIKVVGAPGLDEIVSKDLLNVVPKKKKIVVLQHPDEHEQDAAMQIETTLQAARSFNLPIVIIYPNADAGGRAMIRKIDEFASQNKNLVTTHQSLPRSNYLYLIASASVLVGNSSGGLIETPTLELPVVNIGPRQTGRLRAENVIDTGYDSTEIKSAIQKALTPDFTQTLIGMKNPYGDGKTTERVIEFLNNLTTR